MDYVIGMDRIIRLCDEIYSELGSGHSESVYHKALEIELKLACINFESEVVTPLYYKGSYVGFGRCDILIQKKIIIEIKAVDTLRNVNKQKTNCYMKALGVSEGIMINFPTFPLSSWKNGCEIQKFVQYPMEK